jgi:hypothetical protein
MYIKTKNPITFNRQGSVLGTESAYIYGEINEISIVKFERVRVSFSYLKEQIFNAGETNEYSSKVIIMSGTTDYDSTQIEGLKQLIPSIPAGLTELEETEFKYMQGLKFEMAIAFQIPTTDLEEAQ